MKNKENVILHKIVFDFAERLCDLKGTCVKHMLKDVKERTSHDTN